MGFIVDSPSENIIPVFLVCGLAFYVTSLMLGLGNKKLSEMKLAAGSSFLAALVFLQDSVVGSVVLPWHSRLALKRTFSCLHSFQMCYGQQMIVWLPKENEGGRGPNGTFARTLS